MTDHEAKRFSALKALQILDTPAERSFDRIVELAADLFDAPIALVSLVDDKRQWFKARVGLDACETGRDIAFCTHAIELGPNAVMVVEDASRDPLFASNPLVTGSPDIRFYAGATLTTREGYNLGTLCVIDMKPRKRPSERELGRLKKLAQVVVEEIDLAHGQRETRKRQHLLEMAETMSGVGYWRLDMETQTPVWSDMVYKIYGLEVGSAVPKLDQAIEFFHPDDRGRVVEEIERAIAGKCGYEFQLRLIRADGALRHVISKAACELNDVGDVVALVGLFRDITDHIETLEAVADSEAKYRLLADHSTDLIVKFGPSGVITYASPAVSILGLAPEDVIGKSTVAFAVPEDREFARSVVDELFKGPEPDRSILREFRTRRADGSHMWLQGNPSIVRDEAGKPVEVISTYRDISAHKKLEADLALACAEAEAAAQAKADFLANMSHELRTPLTAVLGFTNLVKEQTDLPEQTLRYIDRAMSAGQALMATVNDILDFSTLEAGQVVIERAPVNAARFMGGVVDIFSNQAFEKGLELRRSGLDDLPDHLSLDGHRVRQVILNLLGNAVKFTGAGFVELAVSHDDAASMLTVRVRDSGPGIAEDAQDRLFHRFSQVDGTSTRKHGGTGLGLAICKGLVEAMGGEIGVESAPDRGSTFWFTIPAVQVTDYLKFESADESAEGLPPQCRILVADDNEAIRMLLSAVLGAMGAEVTTAPDGPSAVATTRLQPFDLILMDRILPGMSGENAAEQIRELGGPNRDIPIIALTAETSRALPAVFDGVAGKPLDMRALVGVMRRALNDGDDLVNAA